MIGWHNLLTNVSESVVKIADIGDLLLNVQEKVLKLTNDCIFDAI